MTIAVEQLLDRVKATLLEDGSDPFWSDQEIVDYLNEGVRFVISQKPSAFTVQDNIFLVAGYRQEIPSNWTELVDAVANYGGRAITMTDREFMDQFDPEWTTATESATIKHVMYDKKDRRYFYVYPPATSGAVLTLKGVEVPDTMNTDSDNLFPLDDIYDVPVMYYALAQCYAKNAIRGDTNKYSDYMAKAGQWLAGRLTAQSENQGGQDGTNR